MRRGDVIVRARDGERFEVQCTTSLDSGEVVLEMVKLRDGSRCRWNLELTERAVKITKAKVIMKRIDLTIAKYNLGDLATDEEGLKLYKAAVERRLGEKFNAEGRPGTGKDFYGGVHIEVDFAEPGDEFKDVVNLSGFEDEEETARTVKQIADEVFHDGSW